VKGREEGHNHVPFKFNTCIEASFFSMESRTLKCNIPLVIIALSLMVNKRDTVSLFKTDKIIGNISG